MGRMDKSREGERGEKPHTGLPPGMDPATAALYANMFGGSGLGGFNPAASGLQGWGGLPPGFPPTSSAAGLASLAAVQQAQQAAALAGLNPAAAWWNLAGMQQMELLSRLQGGLGGAGGGAVAAAAAAAGSMGAYGGLHPEHLMNLEILQAQHAAAMAAALSASKSSPTSSSSGSSKGIRSSSSSSISITKNGSSSLGSSSKGITSTLSYRGGASTTTTTYSSRAQDNLSSSSRPSLEISRLAASSTPSSSSSVSSSHFSSSPSSSSVLSSIGAGRPPPYPYSTSSTPSSSHRYSSPVGLESISSHHSDVGASPSLSYGIASLIADKHPSSSSHPKPPASTPSSSTPSAANNSSQAERVAEKLAGNGSVSISKAIRNKELEIIPISPTVKGSSQSHGTVPPHRDKSEPKVSISTVASVTRLSNGVPGGSAWREESASVSIEPCGPTAPGPPASGEDAPLNLSMKTASVKAVKVGEKRDHKDSQLGSLPLGRSGLPPLDFPPGLAGPLMPGLTPSLEVLQSLYGQPGEPRDVLASMQEALQRQLLGADGKRDEKKKRMEDTQDRSRHLGRGTSKPKKNTVASLLEQCRAAGIKPSLLPLSTTTNTTSMATVTSTSSPLHAVASSWPTGDGLSITSSSPIFNSSSSPSPASQSLPPTLLPGLPLGLSTSSYPSSVGSPAPPTPIPTPPVPSLSISAVMPPVSTSPSSSPSPASPSDTPTTTTTTTTTTVSSTTTTTTSSVTATPSPPPSTTTTTSISMPQPASPPSTPASVTASPPPPPTTTSLPVSLPPSLSLSSSVSITSVTPATSTPNKPSVTIHPTASASEIGTEEFDKMDNSCQDGASYHHHHHSWHSRRQVSPSEVPQ